MVKDYVIVYQAMRISGSGVTSYGNIVVNAPSQDAVIEMFHFLMNGPCSEMWECREATVNDYYRRVPYVDVHKLNG